MCSIQKKRKKPANKTQKSKAKKKFIALDTKHSPSTVAEEATHSRKCRVAVVSPLLVFFRLRARLFVWKVRRERGGEKRKVSKRLRFC